MIFGNNIFSNIFQIGYAYQKGQLPIKAKSFIKALKLNGIKVSENINAFNWGRIAAHDKKYLYDKLNLKFKSKNTATLDDLIKNNYKQLISYQNLNYANVYLNKILHAKNKMKKIGIKDNLFTESVAKYLYKTMAYKDEYEVARLFTDGRFEKEFNNNFKSYDKVYLHLSPPFLGLKDKKTSLPKKIKISAKILFLFKILKKLKFIRNTIFDPFSYTYERRLERKLIKSFYVT